LEPVDGKFLLGVWLNTDTNLTADPWGGDSPVLMNQRTGVSFSMFQNAQNIPTGNTPWAPYGPNVVNTSIIDDTKTDAKLFLTVYANDGLAAVTDTDLKFLGSQLANLTLAGRDVFLRFCPEMNGNWFTFGYQPTLFKSTWIRMATIIRQLAPKVALVWAPNLSAGYPYGGPGPYPLQAQDLAALDTNRNGIVDANDDPFTAYYPGSQYVDWVALSLYYKGLKSAYPWKSNTLCPPDFLNQLIEGGGEGGNPAYNFYKMFSGPNGKPFAISEAGAAFHINSTQIGTISPGPGQLQVHRAFWKSGLFVFHNLT
jgi:hypothetical protein